MNQVGDSLKEGAMLGRRAMKPGQKREQWAVELTKTKKEIQMETRSLSGHSCKKQGQARGEGFLAEKRQVEAHHSHHTARQEGQI